MRRMRHAYLTPTRVSGLVVGLLIGIVLGSRSSEAQYTANYQTNVISGVASNWTGDYVVGNTTFADMLVITNNGVLFNAQGFLGHEASSSNNSVMVSGGVWSSANHLYVGNSGSGNSMVISNGGMVLNSIGTIGYDTGSINNSVLVTGSGSMWNNSSSIDLGEDGSGNSVVVSGGGTVVGSGGWIGMNSGASNNSMLVTGSGSMWNNSSSQVFVGFDGSGNSMVISNGGTVVNSYGTIGVNSDSSNNRVLVTGSGSVWTNSSYVNVGDYGSGNSMVINTSGTVVNTSGRIGYNAGANSNSVLVSGNGSVWSNSSDVNVGYDGSSNSLVISNGGTVVSSNLYVGSNSTSSNNLVTLNGGNLTVTNALTNGVLDVRRGTLTMNSGTNTVDTLLLTNGVSSVMVFNGGSLTTKMATIGTGAVLQFALGTNSNPAAVSSNLTLAGTLNVTDAGGFTNGTYTLFSYGGTLTYNGVTIGTAPSGHDYAINTNTAGQVNLTVTPPNPAHLVIDPVSRDYGTVTVDQSSNQTFSVINTGGQSLSGTATSALPFVVTSGSPYSVTGGVTGTVTVGFSPVVSGIYTGTVIFASNDGSSTNTVTGIGNAPPVVTAGSSQTVTSPSCALLNGSVTDDGLPYGILVSSWSQVSGPGTVTFGNVNVTNTTACFSTNGTYVLQLTASDGAASRSNTVTIAAKGPPEIVTPPAVTNGLMQVGDLAVVATNEPVCFTVGTYDPNGDPMSCLWDFGDGTTSTDCDPCHVFTNCGPYAVSVTVSNEFASTNTTSTVAVACPLTITKMRVKLNFAKTNSDSCTLTGTLDLGPGYNLTNKVVTLDIGDTTNTTFTLDAKGKGKGVGSFGSCKLAYNRRTGLWMLTAKLAKGSWQTPWAMYGLVNATVAKPGASVTMPVVMVIDTEAFAGEHSMSYTAKLNKSGSAK